MINSLLKLVRLKKLQSIRGKQAKELGVQKGANSIIVKATQQKG